MAGMTVGDRIVARPGVWALGGVAVGVALGDAAVRGVLVWGVGVGVVAVGVVAVGVVAVGVAVGGVSISISSWLLNTPTVFSPIELEAWCARRRVFKQGALVELYRVGAGPCSTAEGTVLGLEPVAGPLGAVLCLQKTAQATLAYSNIAKTKDRVLGLLRSLSMHIYSVYICI